jgi:hypothetical protein
MAARAETLLDVGANDPKHWDAEFGSGRSIVSVSGSSATRKRPGHRTMEMALRQYQGFSGVTILMMHDFGASRVTSTRSATRTASASRPSKAAASSHCPARGRPIKAGEFILGYPG